MGKAIGLVVVMSIVAAGRAQAAPGRYGLTAPNRRSTPTLGFTKQALRSVGDSRRSRRSVGCAYALLLGGLWRN